MARYLFSSHDGFGLGHVRRNTLIARAVLARDPDAEVTIVTGLALKPAWLQHERMTVVQVPSLVKHSSGPYRNPTLPFEQALAGRAALFADTVAEVRPDVVVVDRHPYGIGGELQEGLHRARSLGSSLVLGLRDVLDEPRVVATELSGAGWEGVEDFFDEVLVYGERHLCDHELEYGLPMAPSYCGWIADRAPRRPRDPALLVVAGGGGGDGAEVFALGAALTRHVRGLRTILVAGPYATRSAVDDLAADESLAARLQVRRDVAGCAELFAEAGGIVQMAGYNSTFEALAAGIRPVLVPRRNPRREQAIRANRLASLGLADVVDETTPAEEVAWLLSRPRLLTADALADAGIRLDGDRRAAEAIVAHAGVPVG
jgi:predicted glycosyltransferase